MATHPPRARSLPAVVKRIVPQVDKLYVYLNGYKKVPRCLGGPKIEAVLADSTRWGDLGDIGKFYWASKIDGYCLTIDDDLAYPPDYVQECVNAVNKYSRRALIGVHGFTVKKKFGRYLTGRHLFPYNCNVSKDHFVHGVGTGTLSFHTDVVSFRVADCVAFGRNMTDVWVMALAKERKIPVVCMSHRKGWIRALPSAYQPSAIYRSMLRDDSDLTKRVKARAPWDIPSSRWA